LSTSKVVDIHDEGKQHVPKTLTKRARDLVPGDIINWLGLEAQIVAVTPDGEDVVCGLRPMNDARMGPYDRIARFSSDEDVEVVAPD
jgi:hypothetical protein